MGLYTGYLTAKTNKASDEVYTPAYAVRPLLKYLDGYCNKPNYTIWCSFDKEDSEYVKIFRAEGYNVIATHIDTGQNFFYYEPDEWYDFIISNPPFSVKDDIIRRLYELNKPYDILLPIPALQGKSRFPYMKDCEALIFDTRINFYTTIERDKTQSGVSFGSFYLCRRFLPERLIFEELDTCE